MMFIFVHTENLEAPVLTFSSDVELCMHILAVAEKYQLPVKGSKNEHIDPSLPILLNKVRDGHFLKLGHWEARGFFVKSVLGDSLDCPVLKYVNADSIIINQRTFVQHVTNENPELTAKYLKFIGDDKKQVDLIKLFGDAVILDFESDEGEKFLIRFSDLVLKKYDLKFIKITEL